MKMNLFKETELGPLPKGWEVVVLGGEGGDDRGGFEVK